MSRNSYKEPSSGIAGRLERAGDRGNATGNKDVAAKSFKDMAINAREADPRDHSRDHLGSGMPPGYLSIQNLSFMTKYMSTGISPQRLAGSNTSVYMGVNSDDHGKLILTQYGGDQPLGLHPEGSRNLTPKIFPRRELAFYTC
ncbi:hypothetical protein V8E54_014783 [Elaphomyces granulatus]